MPRFSQNKYTRWYYKIVNRAQTRAVENGQYYERHHIVPRSLGGLNNKENLVYLTAREHFIAHWLLTKMTQGADQKKMAYACKQMMHSHAPSQERYRINGKTYQSLRQNLNETLKGREFTAEWQAKLKSAAQKRAANEDKKAKQLRRENMIKANKSRKGEKRSWMQGSKNYFFGKKLTGESNSFYGKKHSEETLKKLKQPKPKFQCCHCKKIIGGHTNYQRWHGNNCKSIKEPLCRD